MPAHALAIDPEIMYFGAPKLKDQLFHLGAHLRFLGYQRNIFLFRKGISVCLQDIRTISKSWPSLSTMLFERYPAVFQELESADRVIEKNIERPDGSRIRISIHNKTFELNGHVIHVSTIRDITSYEKVKQEKEDAERMIRHDYMNYIGAIRLVADSLAHHLDSRDQGDEASRGQARLIEETAKTALELLDTHRKMYRLEEGTYRLTKEPVDINKCLLAVREILLPIAAAKQVGLEVYSGAANLAPADTVEIPGEALLLERAFINLIRNAVEAAPHDSMVTVKLEEAARNGVCIRIHNRGPIPEGIRSRFAQKYVTARRGGLGLGAYSARLFIEAHGGTFTYTTSEEDGTTLMVELPF